MNFLYYNPNILIGQCTHLPGIDRFSQFFKIYNPSVVPIDRTNTITLPFYTKSLFPIPALKPIKKTFEEICNERARELLVRADTLGVSLNVFYSGGIDSTLLLISLLKNATLKQKENLIVLLSEESIRENLNFYRDHIRGKLRVDSVNAFPYFLGTDRMFVGGEHNDQLFGSDMMGKLILRFGPSVIQQPYSQDMFKTFFTEILKEKKGAFFYIELFERLKSSSPIEIRTNQDYLWWINFSLKWQAVFMRMICRVTPRNVNRIDLSYMMTYCNQFYNTEDFQLWSMNNPDKKIKDQWNTYKWVCKDIIFDYTKDADYRDNKIKRGSLYSVFLQQDTYNFIDESMKFYRDLDVSEYCNVDNDFI
ncbi:MAG: hypothetical protein KBC83_02320 [Candidatus Moranbacteria bacterium]|nr:hypothetical protein [Candidatus Moranbacteria bacterium]MBP9801482.1 hypothetical protein [Candidatus Moranbacteria bacterium]